METAENSALYSTFNSANGGSAESNDYGNQNTSPPYKFNVVPFQIENNIDFIDIYEDDTSLIGSSNINGKYWNGSIWSFSDPDLAPLKEKSLTGFGFEYGVTCGKFFGSSQNAIIGDEGGGVSTIQFQELSNTVHCMPLVTSYCHDHSITSLSISKDSLYSVSSSADSCIVVWTNETLYEFKKYMPAHSREVTCVSVSKFHSDLIFGSTSLDGSSLVWDQRCPEPAFCVKEDDTEPLSCIDWKSEYEVALASNFGKVYLVDIRSQQVLHDERLLNIPIVDISFNSSGLLAACGAWNDVVVWDFESSTFIYKDSRHCSTVRGICWHPKNNSLYSCGGAKTILRHDIDLT